MNMKDQIHKVVETLKITAGALEHTIVDLSQKLKTEIQKAKDAKTAETPPPPPPQSPETTSQKKDEATVVKQDQDKPK